ncbi:MAG: hypothetical protein PV340_02710 [Wolbachia sp.]|nr:hypothetical protein [Wolbachia sp.]MDD9336109.1 hypothetical protein [Wolbachia sp.]
MNNVLETQSSSSLKKSNEGPSGKLFNNSSGTPLTDIVVVASDSSPPQ